MSLIMRYRYCPSVDMNIFSVLLCVCDHEMNRIDEEVAELPSNSSFSIVGSIVSFVVTLYFIFPPLESRRTHRRTITMWIWWYYGKREAEEINSNWINSYEGIHRTRSHGASSNPRAAADDKRPLRAKRYQNVQPNRGREQKLSKQPFAHFRSSWRTW